MALEIKTTRDAGGAMATHTPGASGYTNPYGDLFSSLIKHKMAIQQRAQAAPAPQRAPESAPAPAYQKPEAPAYRPTMGSAQSAPKEAPITRMREIPQNPYDAMSRIPGGIGGTGHTNTARVERYIPGVGWEFEGLYDQKGGSGGFAGGGALSTLHASENLGLPGPANPNEANRDDYVPEKGRMPFRAPIDPMNRNNDARGRGFGMDYGRGRY